MDAALDAGIGVDGTLDVSVGVDTALDASVGMDGGADSSESADAAADAGADAGGDADLGEIIPQDRKVDWRPGITCASTPVRTAGRETSRATWSAGGTSR